MKTVLIITQKFFPDPSVGAVRMTQWAKWLPQYGWRPIIVCRNDGFTITREQISELIHPDAEVIYLNNPPSAHKPRNKTLVTRLRSSAINLLGPGIVGAQPRNLALRWAKEGMRKFAASRGQTAEAAFWQQAGSRITDLVELHKPDAIITTSPTAGTHFLGLQLKRDFPNLPWLADFRDVFRQGKRYRTGIVQSCLNRKSWQLETTIYQSADGIICTIPAHQRWIKRRFPEASAKTELIFNGAPEELCRQANEMKQGSGDNFIKVVGFSEAAEAVLLAQAVAKLRNSGVNIKLKFVGKLPSFKHNIDVVLGNNVVFTGELSHSDALKEIVSARVLVAILSENRSRIPAIASKLFEYLAVPRSVVILNPSNSARNLFSRLFGVWMVTRPNAIDIERALSAALRASNDELWGRSMVAQEKWSRRNQVLQLTTILEKLSKYSIQNFYSSVSKK